MPVLFGFLSFHLHRRIRYEGYGPWDHMPQDSTGVAEEQPTDSTPAPRVSTTAAHDGAVTDEWESDEDTPETEGGCLSVQTISTFCNGTWTTTRPVPCTKLSLVSMVLALGCLWVGPCPGEQVPPNTSREHRADITRTWVPPHPFVLLFILNMRHLQLQQASPTISASGTMRIHQGH